MVKIHVKQNIYVDGLYKKNGPFQLLNKLSLLHKVNS